MGNVLVFAEHQHRKFAKTTLVAIAAGKDAATKSGGECYAAVLGKGIDDLANELAQYGVKKVFAVDDPALEHYTADAHAAALAQLVKDKGIETLVATATAVGKDLLPRVAALLGTGMASEVLAFDADGTMKRPMYAGNVVASVRIEGSPKVVSVRATAFDPAAKDGKGDVEKVTVNIDAAAKTTKFVNFNARCSRKPASWSRGDAP
jgi:electron transfer flavoprotein alpha subunit